MTLCTASREHNVFESPTDVSYVSCKRRNLIAFVRSKVKISTAVTRSQESSHNREVVVIVVIYHYQSATQDILKRRYANGEIDMFTIIISVTTIIYHHH